MRSRGIQSMLGALLDSRGAGGAGRRGQMESVGGISGGMGNRGMGTDMPHARTHGMGGDPMLNPNAIINAPDRQINELIDSKMREWFPTAGQKQAATDNGLLAKLLPNLNAVTQDSLPDFMRQASAGGMSAQGQIGLYDLVQGRLDRQEEQDWQRRQKELAIELQLARLNTEQARQAKVRGGGSGAKTPVDPYAGLGGKIM